VAVVGKKEWYKKEWYKKDGTEWYKVQKKVVQRVVQRVVQTEWYKKEWYKGTKSSTKSGESPKRVSLQVLP
jgi:hypothetical protein